MTPNLKLQEAIEGAIAILKDTESGCGCSYGTEAGKHISILVDAAQSIIDKPSGEVTKIVRTANNEIIAITYEGKQYYPKELHPAISREAKQMTVQEINQIIRNHFATVFQKPDLMIAIVEAGNNLATALFEAVYGGEYEKNNSL